MHRYVTLNLIRVAFRMQMWLMRVDYVNENGLALCETCECVLFASREVSEVASHYALFVPIVSDYRIIHLLNEIKKVKHL